VDLFGFGLACLMVILGLMAATDSLGRQPAPGEAGAGETPFYAIPIADIGFLDAEFSWLPPSVQGCYAQAAHADRLNYASGRGFRPLARPATWRDIRVAQMCCSLLLHLLMCYDLWGTGKVHRVTLWASVLLNRASGLECGGYAINRQLTYEGVTIT
jgi:hypothetical protein